MPAMLQETIPLPSDDLIVAHLISSHGDVELASERLKIPTTDLLLRLPHLPQELLRKALTNALSLQVFDTLTILRRNLLENLSELTPALQARLLTDLFAQLSALSATPPVQGNTPTTNILNVMNGENDSAKLELARMLERLTPQEQLNGSDDARFADSVVIPTTTRTTETR